MPTDATHMFQLVMTDTGHGMDAETARQIFDPFFTTKPAGEGTGMGLAIVQSIIKSWGGNISCVSEKHKGTTFTIQIPEIAS